MGAVLLFLLSLLPLFAIAVAWLGLAGMSATPTALQEITMLILLLIAAVLFSASLIVAHLGLVRQAITRAATRLIKELPPAAKP